MFQCEECELFEKGPSGKIVLRCNPFSTVKEESCLLKWQLLKMEALVQAYQATVRAYQRLAPMQEKLFRHLEREIDDADDVDSWKYRDEDDEDEDQSDTP